MEPYTRLLELVTNVEDRIRLLVANGDPIYNAFIADDDRGREIIRTAVMSPEMIPVLANVFYFKRVSQYVNFRPSRMALIGYTLLVGPDAEKSPWAFDGVLITGCNKVQRIRKFYSIRNRELTSLSVQNIPDPGPEDLMLEVQPLERMRDETLDLWEKLRGKI